MFRNRFFFSARALTSAAALFAVGCSAGANDPSSEKLPLLGAVAPELAAEPVCGEGPTTLGDARGKVIVVDFWGTFCEPCKKSFSKYQELVDRFGGKVAVIAVSVDEPETTKPEDLKAFASENGAKFRVVWDKEQRAVDAYGVRHLTMPSSFVIDKKGTVRHVHVGFHEGEEIVVAGELEALVAE